MQTAQESSRGTSLSREMGRILARPVLYAFHGLQGCRDSDGRSDTEVWCVCLGRACAVESRQNAVSMRHGQMGVSSRARRVSSSKSILILFLCLSISSSVISKGQWQQDHNSVGAVLCWTLRRSLGQHSLFKPDIKRKATEDPCPKEQAW
jgi:hypothetical protein